jgi:hypothetical protein
VARIVVTGAIVAWHPGSSAAGVLGGEQQVSSDESSAPRLEVLHRHEELEVTMKLLFEWQSPGAAGRVIQLSFSDSLDANQIGIALISQEVSCEGDSSLRPNEVEGHLYQGPLLARVVPDLDGIDSTKAAASFKVQMASADSMKSWSNPCREGHIYLSFTSKLQELLQGGRRTLYLLVYSSSPRAMTFSEALPTVRLIPKNVLMPAERR